MHARCRVGRTRPASYTRWTMSLRTMSPAADRPGQRLQGTVAWRGPAAAASHTRIHAQQQRWAGQCLGAGRAGLGHRRPQGALAWRGPAAAAGLGINLQAQRSCCAGQHLGTCRAGPQPLGRLASRRLWPRMRCPERARVLAGPGVCSGLGFLPLAALLHTIELVSDCAGQPAITETRNWLHGHEFVEPSGLAGTWHALYLTCWCHAAASLVCCIQLAFSWLMCTLAAQAETLRQAMATAVSASFAKLASTGRTGKGRHLGQAR